MKLIFSDESGEPKKNDYYIRSAVMIFEQDYFDLQRKFLDIKEEYEIPMNEELKLADVWHLKKYQECGHDLPSKISERLEKYTSKDYRCYLKFIEKSLELLSDNTIIIIVWTYFFDRLVKSRDEIERDFLKIMMLRAEDELKENNERGIFFYDEIHMKKISQYYSKMFLNGEFIGKYEFIKDSITFEVSTYSSGIQLADYVANIIRNSLKEYKESLKMFKKFIKPKLRKKEGYRITQTGFIPIYLEGYQQGGNQLINEKLKLLGLIQD